MSCSKNTYGTDITVDVNNNSITINTRPVADLNKLFNDFVGQNSDVIRNYGFTSFQELNKKINFADSVKDGTNGATLTQLGLFSPFILDDLKTLVHSIVNRYVEKQFITAYNFTRDKKGDESVLKIFEDYGCFDVEYDSGLGLKNYLRENRCNVLGTFGKYIDPSSKIALDNSFLETNKNLIITEKMFNQIGYENTYITSCASFNVNDYNYNITISDTPIANEKIKRDNDKNLENLFAGNKEKNKVIKSSGNANLKKALVVAKGLGDKLQVFITYIYSLIEPNNNKIKCVSTCDEIVFLFCIILKLPCFYTSIGLLKDGSSKVKINKVLYYNESSVNPKNLLLTFNTEKKKILDGYKSFIDLLYNINEESIVFITGDSNEYKFNTNFFINIAIDLANISNFIQKNIVISNVEDIKEISNKTFLIKECQVNNFIRVNPKMVNNKNRYVIMLAAKYHKSKKLEGLMGGLSKDRVIDGQNKYNKETFVKIAQDIYYVSKKESRGGGQLSSEEDTFKDFFYDEPIYVRVHENEQYYIDNKNNILIDSETEEPLVVPIANIKDVKDVDTNCFDANLALLEEMKEIYRKIDPSFKYFWSVYSEAFCEFNCDYRTSHLIHIIRKIYNEINVSQEDDRMEISEPYNVPIQTPNSPMMVSQSTPGLYKTTKMNRSTLPPSKPNKFASRYRGNNVTKKIQNIEGLLSKQASERGATLQSKRLSTGFYRGGRKTRKKRV